MGAMAADGHRWGTSTFKMTKPQQSLVVRRLGLSPGGDIAQATMPAMLA
jgi:hypothetical protein